MTKSDAQNLWNENFLLYWLGIALAALGDALVYIALPFLVLGMTGSPEALAAVVLLNSLPRFLGPLVGALADRLHLRVPLMVVAVLRTGIFAVLALLALAGDLHLWLVYVAAPTSALLSSFVFAAGNVLVPHLVPREQLARANSLMQGALMGVPLLGLGAAGALVAAFGAGTTILMATPCFLALALVCPWIAFPSVARAGARPALLPDIAAGVRFLVGSGPLAFLLVVSLLLNAVLNVLNVAMPVTMERVGRGAQGYGLFESALSAGMLAGILAVSLVGQRLAPRHQISLSQAVMALGFLVLAAGGFAWFLGGGAVLGLGLGFSEVASITLLQLAVPDGMRGKVLGIIFSVNALGLTLGAYLAGRLIETVPVGTIYLAASAVVLLMCITWTALHIRQRQVLDRLIEAAA